MPVRVRILLIVVFVIGGAAARAEIVWLRQTGNSNPNGNGVYQNGSSAVGGGAILPFFFTNSTPNVLQLSHGDMGVSAYTSDGLKTSGMYGTAWTPAGFFGGNPLSPGDLVGHAAVAVPTITTVGSASIFGDPITNYRAAWDTRGSLFGLNFVLQPGQSAYFTIAVPGQDSSTGGWFPRESTFAAMSDSLWSSASGYLTFEQISWTQFNGHLEGNWAFVPVFHKGDLNCDGTINTLDVGPFIEALLDPAGWGGSHQDCQIQNADINGDGSVNGLDVAGFAACLLSGCS